MTDITIEDPKASEIVAYVKKSGIPECTCTGLQDPHYHINWQAYGHMVGPDEVSFVITARGKP